MTILDVSHTLAKDLDQPFLVIVKGLLLDPVKS